MKNVCFKWYALFSILISYSLLAYAQHIPERFETVTDDPNALGTFVDGILQDSQGYLWIKSLDGLFKYDGYTTTKYRYDPFNPNSISQNIIYSFWIDKNDTIWLGTPEGLCKFDPHAEKFTRYDSPLFSGMPNLGNVSAINEDNEGKLWIANYDGKLWRYDKGKRLFITMTSNYGWQTQSEVVANFHEATYCIYKDKGGNLWIGTSAGMYKVTIKPYKHGEADSISFTHYQHNTADNNSLSSNHVRYIFEDHVGTIWIATENGLNSFEPQTKKFTRFSLDSSNPLFISTSSFTWSRNTIVEDSSNNLWIATGNGLFKLNNERTKFSSWYENQNSDYGLKSSQVYAIGLDRGGNLLISTANGLQRLGLNQKSFDLLQHDAQVKNSISGNDITGIAEDNMGNIWIGNYGGGVDKWNKLTGVFTHYQHDLINPNSLKSNNVNDLLIDPDGNLYVCNQEYLSIMKKGATVFEHYNTNSRNLKDLDAFTIYSICRDTDGLIWMGTGNGIKSFNPVTKKITHYYYEPGNRYDISDYTALSIFADSRGNIWVGTGSIAFNKFDKQTGSLPTIKTMH